MSDAQEKKRKTKKTKRAATKTTKKKPTSRTSTKKKGTKKATRKKATKKTRKKATARKHRAAAAVEAEPIQVQAEAPPSPESVVTSPYIDRGAELPAGFGDDHIRAMVRDPDWIFVYWELYGDGSNQLVQTHGSGRDFTQLPWHLRVLDQDGAVQQEIGVYVGANNWYVRTGETKHASVQIGFYNETGEFFVAATTEQVASPRGTPSEDGAETWAKRVPGRALRPGERAFDLDPATPPPGEAVDLTETSDRAGRPTSPGRYPPSGRPPYK